MYDFEPLFNQLKVRKISIARLAEMSGISRNTLFKLKKKCRMLTNYHPGMDIIVRLIRCLKCSFSDIVRILPEMECI